MRLPLVLAALLALPVQAGEIPDPALTPGIINGDLSLDQICTTRWGKDHRAVTRALKRAVFRRYGIAWSDRARFEVDHLIARELGGADAVENLWPEEWQGRFGAHAKDRIENRVHREVCAGRMTVEAARDGIVRDWRVLYRQFFGEPP